MIWRLNPLRKVFVNVDPVWLGVIGFDGNIKENKTLIKTTILQLGYNESTWQLGIFELIFQPNLSNCPLGEAINQNLNPRQYQSKW
jgi:hypothetical protein